MIETNNGTPREATVHDGLSAGQMLRQARESQGLHIAALAVALKVHQRKLEALEADRLDELPDATFSRALAQTVCRHLKIDPKPVLDRLPRAGYGPRLEEVSRGMNEPFRQHGALPSVSMDWSTFARPGIIAPALLVVAALLVAFWPHRDDKVAAKDINVTAPPAVVAADPSGAPGAAGATVSPASSPPAAAALPPSGPVAAPVVDTVHSAPPVPLAGASAPIGSPVVEGAPSGVVVLRTTEESWVEVRDAGNQVLVSRTVNAGESVGLDGAAPFRVKIGNVSGTQLSFRGNAVDLSAYRKENVARLTLE
jgi:cytoskeleton protein RodZ